MFVYQLMHIFVLESTKTYLKFTWKCSYMFRSTTIIGDLVLGPN